MNMIRSIIKAQLMTKVLFISLMIFNIQVVFSQTTPLESRLRTTTEPIVIGENAYVSLELGGSIFNKQDYNLRNTISLEIDKGNEGDRKSVV